MINDFLLRRYFEKYKKYLSLSDPEIISRSAEKKIVKTFKHVSKNIPAYRRLLEKSGIKPSRIKSLKDFEENVPVIDKKTVFYDNDFKKFLNRCNLNMISKILAGNYDINEKMALIYG